MYTIPVYSILRYLGRRLVPFLGYLSRFIYTLESTNIFSFRLGTTYINLLYSISITENRIPLPVPLLYIISLVRETGIDNLYNIPNISCYILGKNCYTNSPSRFRYLPIAP